MNNHNPENSGGSNPNDDKFRDNQQEKISQLPRMITGAIQRLFEAIFPVRNADKDHTIKRDWQNVMTALDEIWQKAGGKYTEFISSIYPENPSATNEAKDHQMHDIRKQCRMIGLCPNVAGLRYEENPQQSKEEKFFFHSSPLEYTYNVLDDLICKVEALKKPFAQVGQTYDTIADFIRKFLESRNMFQHNGLEYPSEFVDFIYKPSKDRRKFVIRHICPHPSQCMDIELGESGIPCQVAEEWYLIVKEIFKMMRKNLPAMLVLDEIFQCKQIRGDTLDHTRCGIVFTFHAGYDREEEIIHED